MGGGILLFCYRLRTFFFFFYVFGLRLAALLPKAEFLLLSKKKFLVGLRNLEVPLQEKDTELKVVVRLALKVSSC